MCGICGVYTYANTAAPVDEALLIRMSNEIAHRGPDDSGTYLSPGHRAGFGFRRLAIVDLSPAAHQPMSTPDGGATIIFNGEIYNHGVLRRDLEAKGYRYRSRSDTESILYAYREYGLNFVHRLLGMFALAIWDDRSKQLVLVRDRVGVKPLYYSFVNGSVVFGSEIKALLQHPDVHRELDEEAMMHYLTFLISPAPLTMFRNIYKLEPGHLMVIGQDGMVKKEQYWSPVPAGAQPSIDIDGTPVDSSPFFDGHRPRTEEECVGTIRALLKQSVKDRMMSDVPFGVFLSGGIDSSTNVALMAQLMNRPVDTFSVGFKDLEQYNELDYARQVAREFSTNHHEIIISHNEAFEFLPKLIYHQDEPLADPVCIPLYFVSKLARDNGTIVVQIGEGSDELFSGYSWMQRELMFHNSLWRFYRALPKLLRQATHAVAGPLLRARGQLLALDYIRKGTQDDELFWGGAISFTETHKALLLNGGRDGSYDTHAFARQWHSEILKSDPGADYLKRMIFVELKNRLPELLLMRVDKIAMAASVEGREPFLDHRLVEFAMTIPARLKIKNGVSKYILKKAVEGIIPDRIIRRKKQGFAAPMHEWLRNEWGAFVESSLMNSPLLNNGYFNKEYVGQLVKDHRFGKKGNAQNLWTLMNLVLWHRSWIEGKPIT